MRSIGGFPVHNYGMDQLARGIEVGAERYRMQKEQEEKNRAELVKLMEEKKTVAFDQFSKILELQDKYPEQAAHFSKLAQQRAEVLGIPFDPATFTNSADQKKALRSQVIGELSATLEAGMQNPTDNAAIKTAELFRRAAKLGIKKDELEVYQPLYTDLMKRVQESRTREHAGFDAQGKPVYKIGGKLMYGPNRPYEGGPLQPTTKGETDFDRWKRNPKEYAKFKAAGNQPKPMTADDAMKRISAIEQAKSRIKNTGGLDAGELALLTMVNPQAATMMKSGDTDNAIKSLDVEKNYLMQYVPEKIRSQYEQGQEAEDFGASDQPEGTTASNKEGVKIVTKNGRWVKM